MLFVSLFDFFVCICKIWFDCHFYSLAIFLHITMLTSLYSPISLLFVCLVVNVYVFFFSWLSLNLKYILKNHINCIDSHGDAHGLIDWNMIMDRLNAIQMCIQINYISRHLKCAFTMRKLCAVVVIVLILLYSFPLSVPRLDLYIFASFDLWFGWLNGASWCDMRNYSHKFDTMKKDSKTNSWFS